MSEWNLIYNTDGRKVGVISRGVAWTSPNHDECGEYFENIVYDNKGSCIATLLGETVRSVTSQSVGHIVSNTLYLSNMIDSHVIETQKLASPQLPSIS